MVSRSMRSCAELVIVSLKMTGEEADVDNEKVRHNNGFAVSLLEMYP
jgi:hypothetical protein